MVIDNRYTVLEKLGAGGIGEVYRVHDKIKDRKIALKLLIHSKSEEKLLHLKREFLTMASLKHPHIAEVYDFVLVKKGTPYFTMEYIHGVDLIKATENLRKVGAIRELPLQNGCKKTNQTITYEVLYTLIVQICQTLEFIHSQDLVHCDIKPGNILIAEGNKPSNLHAKLLDFGLVETVEFSTSKGMRGTIEYMSPEMIRGAAVDGRADLYSLGVLLYEAVTGKLPFKGETPLSILKQHLEKSPTSPRKYVKDIPEGLNQIILKLLYKRPDDRYQSAREVISEITQITGKKFALETQKIKRLLSSRFVGREKELSQLNSLLPKEKGAVISISGDLGIGKSRLIEEFRIQAQLNGWGFWKGTCHQEQGEVYGPIVELLNGVIRMIESKHTDLIEDYREALGHFVPRLKEKSHTPSVSLMPEQEKIRSD